MDEHRQSRLSRSSQHKVKTRQGYLQVHEVLLKVIQAFIAEGTVRRLSYGPPVQ